MFLRQITDSALAQNAYLIGCQRTQQAILIDPQRDVERYLQIAAANNLQIIAVAETHIHADYLSGARELVTRHGALAYLSAEGGSDWQFEWAKEEPKARFLHDGDRFQVGNLSFQAVLTPGHTPEHLCFLLTDHGADEPMALFSGDFIFVGDVGRPDLLESAAGQIGAMKPGARSLYVSLRATAALPDHLQLLPAHGAGSACGKDLGAVPTSVLGYERKFNPALREALNLDQESFVDHILAGQPEPPPYFARMKRDNKLGPALLPNGELPTPERTSSNRLPEILADPNTAILDLRADRQAFARCHLRGAIHAPMAAGRFIAAAGSYLDEGERILLVVEQESDLPEAVRQLVRIGLDRIEHWISAEDSLSDSSLTTSLVRTESKNLPPGATVLDVRSAEEFRDAHVKGATNIAYTQLATRLKEIPLAQPLLVHCGSGLRAAIGASFLASKGRSVTWVDGSFAELPASLITAL